jgi:hypothetical protein
MYPGSGGGREFIYPHKADSQLIARAEVVEIPVTDRG